MGDSATSMRDPVFYRWHAFIDNIFEDFKATLPRYTQEQVKYKYSIDLGNISDRFYVNEIGCRSTSSFWLFWRWIFKYGHENISVCTAFLVFSIFGVYRNYLTSDVVMTQTYIFFNRTLCKLLPVLIRYDVAFPIIYICL